MWVENVKRKGSEQPFGHIEIMTINANYCGMIGLGRSCETAKGLIKVLYMIDYVQAKNEVKLIFPWNGFYWLCMKFNIWIVFRGEMRDFIFIEV